MRPRRTGLAGVDCPAALLTVLLTVLLTGLLAVLPTFRKCAVIRERATIPWHPLPHAPGHRQRQRRQSPPQHRPARQQNQHRPAQQGQRRGKRDVTAPDAQNNAQMPRRHRTPNERRCRCHHQEKPRPFHGAQGQQRGEAVRKATSKAANTGCNTQQHQASQHAAPEPNAIRQQADAQT